MGFVYSLVMEGGLGEVLVVMKLKVIGCTIAAIVAPMGVLAQDAAVEDKAEKKVVKADSVDGIAAEVAGKLKKLPMILGEVKDEASAEASVRKIETLSDDLLALSKRLEKLDVPSEAKKKEISDRFEEEMKDVQKQMTDVMVGLSAQPELLGKLNVAMQGFGQKLDKSGKVFERYFEPKESEKTGEESPEKPSEKE